uniref:LisH domain-containing protein n=1 Tax=Rhabditophanes sp. KR3021 TaxID=114890 RepID=A0AC35TUR1_9BILA
MSEIYSTVDELVLNYLRFRGFADTVKSLEAESKNPRDKKYQVNTIMGDIAHSIDKHDFDSLRKILNYFNEKLFSSMVPGNVKLAKEYENELYRLYLINTIKAKKPQKAIEFFEKNIDFIRNNKEWEDWYALPYISDPQERLCFKKYFLKQFHQTLFVSYHNFLSLALDNTQRNVLSNSIAFLTKSVSMDDNGQLIRTINNSFAETKEGLRIDSRFEDDVDLMDDFTVLGKPTSNPVITNTMPKGVLPSLKSFVSARNSSNSINNASIKAECPGIQAQSTVNPEFSTSVDISGTGDPCSFKGTDYEIKWSYHKETDKVEFEYKVPVKSGKWWSSIGIGDNMSDMDIGAIFLDSGLFKHIGDYFSDGYKEPKFDVSQDWKAITEADNNKLVDGFTSFKVYRKLVTEDNDKDRSLDGCVLFQFGANLGHYASPSGDSEHYKIKKHKEWPDLYKACDIKNKCLKVDVEENGDAKIQRGSSRKESETIKVGDKIKGDDTIKETSSKGEVQLVNTKCRVSNPKYELSWKFIENGDAVEFTFTYPVSSGKSWSALTFGTSVKRDALMIFTENGKVIEIGDYVIKNLKEQKKDKQQDWTIISSSIDKDTKMGKFVVTRPISTSDKKRDKPLEGCTQVQFALNMGGFTRKDNNNFVLSTENEPTAPFEICDIRSKCVVEDTEIKKDAAPENEKVENDLSDGVVVSKNGEKIPESEEEKPIQVRKRIHLEAIDEEKTTISLGTLLTSTVSSDLSTTSSKIAEGDLNNESSTPKVTGSPEVLNSELDSSAKREPIPEAEASDASTTNAVEVTTNVIEITTDKVGEAEEIQTTVVVEVTSDPLNKETALSGPFENKSDNVSSSSVTNSAIEVTTENSIASTKNDVATTENDVATTESSVQEATENIIATTEAVVENSPETSTNSTTTLLDHAESKIETPLVTNIEAKNDTETVARSELSNNSTAEIQLLTSSTSPPQVVSSMVPELNTTNPVKSIESSEFDNSLESGDNSTSSSTTIAPEVTSLSTENATVLDTSSNTTVPETFPNTTVPETLSNSTILETSSNATILETSSNSSISESTNATILETSSNNPISESTSNVTVPESSLFNITTKAENETSTPTTLSTTAEETLNTTTTEVMSEVTNATTTVLPLNETIATTTQETTTAVTPINGSTSEEKVATPETINKFLQSHENSTDNSTILTELKNDDGLEKTCGKDHKDLSICSSYMTEYLDRVKAWANNHNETLNDQLWKACALLHNVPHVPTLCCHIFTSTCGQHIRSSQKSSTASLTETTPLAGFTTAPGLLL